MPSHGTDRLEPMGVNWIAENAVELERTEGPGNFQDAWATSFRVMISHGDVHLEIIQKVENLESRPRERAIAFHPYFLNFGGLQVVAPRSLVDSPEPKLPKVVNGVPQIILKVGKYFVHQKFTPMPVRIVDWREDDGHRCLEPWWGDLGKGVFFGPGEKRTFRMGIKVFPLE